MMKLPMLTNIIKVRTAREMAVIAAELTRENIRFRAEKYGDEWTIEITGY